MVLELSIPRSVQGAASLRQPSVSPKLPSKSRCAERRGGNRSDADRIVPFPYPFPYFQNEYGCGYGCYRIRIRNGCYSNTNTDRMISQFGVDTNIRK
jgi:hypothetical protein